MGRRRIRIEVDARTANLSYAALVCRSMSHPWDRVKIAPARRAQLLALGQTETVWNCIRCGARRIDLFELPSFDTLSTRIEYPQGYLIDKGTGRLPKVMARRALYDRDLASV